jgi:acetolactate synthase-1/2/3 large subunit
MRNLGVPPGGPKAEALTDIGHPRIDWISLARSFGVEAFRATTADELSRHIDAGLALQGPVVVEAAL